MDVGQAARQEQELHSKMLGNDIRKLAVELGMTINIDSDSRGEDGSDSIDTVILGTVANYQNKYSKLIPSVL